MKLCVDRQCPRLGQRLRASDFPRNRNRADGRNPYCCECARRRSNECRARKRAVKKAQQESRAIVLAKLPERKPSIKAAEEVTKAIQMGATTREAIQEVTHLDYDLLGEVLADLVWKSGIVRIKRLDNRREFVLRLAA